MAVHHRILDGDPLDRRIPASREQRGAFVEALPHECEAALAIPRRIGRDDVGRIDVAAELGRRLAQPAYAAVAKAGAGRMHDGQQIPAVVQEIADVADDVSIASVLGWQESHDHASCPRAVNA